MLLPNSSGLHQKERRTHFQDIISRLKGASLLIADEVHHLGAERSRESYPTNISSVLALSATPDRWFDEEGTAAIRNFFGETVFSFPLEKAIGVSLTPYYYYPHLVPLTEEELEQYELLSTKIAPLLNREDLEGQEMLKMLLIRRAELLNKAVNKLETLSTLLIHSRGPSGLLRGACRPLRAALFQKVTRSKGVLAQLAMRLRTEQGYVGILQTTIYPEASADLAYLVFPPFWRQGYAREGCRRIVDLLFKDYQVHTLWAEIDTRNKASIHVIESLGFRRVATKLHADFFKGATSHEYRYKLRPPTKRDKRHLGARAQQQRLKRGP